MPDSGNFPVLSRESILRSGTPAFGMTNASADICKAADKRLLKMSGKKEDMTQKYHVLIEQDEDGVFIGKVLELQGCVTQGDTLDELMKNVREAIELCLEMRQEKAPEERVRFLRVQEVEV